MTDEIETKKPEPKPKPPKKVTVRLISHQGESALVEWNDGRWKRAYIPLSEFDFEKRTVSEDVLSMGIPFGVDWSRLDVSVDPIELDNELKKRNIWTAEDLLQNPGQANAAINKISGMMRRQMLDAAKETK